MTTGIRAGANSSDARFALVPEVAWGTTPATPAFKNLRMLSESIQVSKNTVRSEEIRPDRNVADEIMVGRSAGGDISFELSYGTYDELFESLFNNAWATNVLKNGTAETKAFTGERTLKLADASSHYTRYQGLVVNTMSLDIASGQKVTGSFGLMGKFGSAGTAAIAGATYATASTAPIMNAAAHFASLSMTGITSPRIKRITLNATNNMRGQDAVGSLDNVGLANGRFEVSGSIEAYFQAGFLDAFLNHTDLALAFTIGAEAGSRYRFTIPTIKLTGSPGGNAGGNDNDVMSTVNFTAILDRLTGTPLGCALQLERAV
ncbi:MAG TPA: phage tail tube protein [Tianweitania sediminis]|nr:phage tail tube protein [Tianweitania sediminis]